MYRYMAIANYEDRFVIPSSHREAVIAAYDEQGSCGFTFGNGCSDGNSEISLFGNKKKPASNIVAMPKSLKSQKQGA
jgi:nitrate reductase beta subunit